MKYSPQHFFFYIGGYPGPYYTVTKKGKALIYSWEGRDESDELHSEIIEFYPTKAQWLEFWADVENIDIWSWDEEYVAPDAVDGTQWKLDLKFDGKSLKCTGSNKYPGQSRQDRLGLYTETFKTLLSATRKLIGGLDLA